ncbi:TPA: FAD-binding oxidoreductase, partial [Aeromonas veronii]
MTAIIKITPANITFNAVENRTILDSALSSNIALEHSCKNGSCGLCETTIIQGEVTDAQGNVFMAGQKFLTCQCQCRSEILTIEAEYHPELSGQVRKVVPCKVVAATQYQDFLTIKFRLPPTANFNYLPGQYINLSYQGITRSYSVASANTTSGLELHIRRVNDGAMSQLLFDNEIKPDTLMRLDGPIGTFFIRADTRPIIFLAGGTGFAPVKAMVEHIIAQGCTRQIHIYWGMNSSKDFYSE